MMKKIIIACFFLPLFVFSQKTNLTFNQTTDIEYVKQYKNNTSINSYKTKDGLLINIGDTLTIGNALTTKEKYMFNDVFSYIVMGKDKGTTDKEFIHLSHNASGKKIIVHSLFVRHQKPTGYNLWSNRREMPLYVSAFVKNIDSENNSSRKIMDKVFKTARKTILNLELALSSGEIINSNAPLSKEEAIKKLKESKDLMELELLSKEEYQKLKEKLSPIILDK